MSRVRAWAWLAGYALVVVAAAAAVTGLRSDSRALVFLRPDDPVRRDYDRFVARFGEDTFVLVTCRGDGSAAFRGRVGALATALRASDAVRWVDVPEPGSEPARKLRLVDEAGHRVSLAVTLARQDEAALADVRAVLKSFTDLAPRLAGQPALNVSLKRASDTVGQRLFPVLALAMLLFLTLAYRSARVTLAVAVVTLTVLLVGMAVIALSGPVNLITILLPVLLLALTVALCVHLVGSYRRHLARSRSVRAAVDAMRAEEWRPCLVTSLTTAAGFGSFGLTRIEPLRVLGVAMAVSILAAFAVAYTLLPALLVVLRPRPREGLAIGPRLVRWVPGLVARPALVATVLFVAVGAALVAIPRIPLETNALNYLPASDPLRVETARLAGEGVGTASLEVLFRPAAGQSLATLAGPLDAFELAIDAWSAAGGEVRGVVTPLTLAREGARRLRLGPNAPVASLAFTPLAGDAEERLARFRDLDAPAARASVRIDAVDVTTYRHLRARVESAAEDALAAAPGATFRITGEFPVIMTVQEQLLGALLVSLGGTLATIVAILVVATRSLRLALLTLLPAALPVAFVLIACALAGVALSIATVMVLAVTLGIVTDDSVHMLHALRAGKDLPHVLRRVGTAVTETSIAIFLGFAVLAYADFLPTRDFGWLTAGAMVVALFSDLVLFPVALRWKAPRARPAAVPPGGTLVAAKETPL